MRYDQPVNTAPRIFDRRLYALRRARAARMEGERFLLTEALGGICERLGAVNRGFAQGLELASRPESAAALAPFAENWTRMSLSAAEGGNVVGDEEVLPFAEGSFDLVVSALSLHAVNDLPGALVQIRRILKPDGLFLAVLFGGQSLRELRDAFARGEMRVRGGISPHVSPFADVRALGALLQRAGFALPVADSEQTCISYKQFCTLANDIRELGETNVLAERDKSGLRRDVLGAMLAAYGEHHGTEAGKLKASFDLVTLTGWAPHESQQQPLRPGSARMRLADALGTREQRPGEERD
jgi:SAM-dependent methyltransferase